MNFPFWTLPIWIWILPLENGSARSGLGGDLFAMSVKVDAIFRYLNPGFGFYFLEKFDREFDMNIENLLGVEAVNVTMGVADVAVESSVGPIDTFNYTLVGKSFEILVDGGVADFFSLMVKSVVDGAGGEMLPIGPQQF